MESEFANLVGKLAEKADTSQFDFVIDFAKDILEVIVDLVEEGDEDSATEVIANALETIDKYEQNQQNDEGWLDDLFVNDSALEELASVASLMDKSGVAMLQKQAAVLDEILLTIGASKQQVAAAKSAQDLEVAKIKAHAQRVAEAAKDKPDDLYGLVKKEHDRWNKVEEAGKTIDDKVKHFRPLEAPLKTRTCPDHPGAQMARIAEDTWQCSLDKKQYNYEAGFTTMNGQVVPGGAVMNQTIGFDRPNEFVSFDTRESRLNS